VLAIRRHPVATQASRKPLRPQGDCGEQWRLGQRWVQGSVGGMLATKKPLCGKGFRETSPNRA